MVSVEKLIESGTHGDHKLVERDVAAPGAPEVTALRPPHFDIDTQRDEFTAYLEEHGYAVIKSAADPKECTEIKGKMWDFLESIPGTAVRRDNVETWGLKGDWLPSRTNGIIHGFGFGQCAAMWQMRLLPRVKSAFEAIWKTDDLIVSYDGGNIFLPYEYNREWRTQGGWYHVDQNYMRPQRQGRVCVQGLVTLCDANETTGGLVVVPKSHKFHKDFCESSPLAKGFGDFVPVPVGDPMLDGGARLICAEAGSLILWDSRTIHCNTPSLVPAQDTDMIGDADGEGGGSSSLLAAAAATAAEEDKAEEAKDAGGDDDEEPGREKGKRWEPIRMVGYVCMTPARAATKDVLEKRVDAFINQVSTSHWPHAFVRAGVALPGTPPNDLEKIGPEQRKLIGLDRPSGGGRNCVLM